MNEATCRFCGSLPADTDVDAHSASEGHLSMARLRADLNASVFVLPERDFFDVRNHRCGICGGQAATVVKFPYGLAGGYRCDAHKDTPASFDEDDDS